MSKILVFMQNVAYKPLTLKELEEALEIKENEDLLQFENNIEQLENEGRIVRTRTNRYGVPERMNLVRGRLQGHQKGFGFVISDTAGDPDVYIHANDMNTAMNGDIVLARVHGKANGPRLEGEIIRIIERKNVKVVGTYADHDSYGFVMPDDKRLDKEVFISKGSALGAVDGSKVVVEIVSYPEGRKVAEGIVVEVLGHRNDPGVDILSIIRKFNLPEEFPEDVIAEANSAPETITEEEIQGRRDLRDKRMVTIDGEDAKDLDDAVSIEILENGNIRLGVHIADVSYYVKEGSALNREAYDRGSSVYLVDRVIPMLPHRLSNGICSLNPQVDRLTLSCEMEFDRNTTIVRHEIFASVIRTNERMTYTNVRKILTEHDEDLIERYNDLVDDFRQMENLAMRLREKRMNRGAIDFDFQESKILVDEEGNPTEIVKRERSVAEKLIEEFMLVANETVAEHFHWMKMPFIYRIHEDPDSDKLQRFTEFIANFGYFVRGSVNSVHPRALQQLLEEIKGTTEETVISTVMLRSMKQARYEAESLGHFGLSTEFYTHFTSPIRRYPDLIVHRLIREMVINAPITEARIELWRNTLSAIAQYSSERERVAVEAERETDSLKKAQFMLDKIGDEFDGLISSVTSFGMFVELTNSVEGLIHVSDLTDDYYYFHEKQLALIGERTSKVFRIGDEARVRVTNVNMKEYTVDFELVESKESKPNNNKKARIIDNKGSNGPIRAKSPSRDRKKGSSGQGTFIKSNDKKARSGNSRGSQSQGNRPSGMKGPRQSENAAFQPRLGGQTSQPGDEAKKEKKSFWEDRPKKKKKPTARKRNR